jgi:hypothetical protein
LSIGILIVGASITAAIASSEITPTFMKVDS